MHIFRVLFFGLISISFFGQNMTKNEILKCYSIGSEIKEYIEQNDTIELKRVFEESEFITEFLEIVENGEYKNDGYKLVSDIYFNPDMNKYIFTIFSAKWTANNSDWGLNNYLFIIELIIEYDKEMKNAQLVNKTILNKSSNLKVWWQSYMDSYNQSKYLRKDWRDKHKLRPPPPPPPETAEWFKK